MLAVGIDPGLDGAIVAVDASGCVMDRLVMPTLHAGTAGRRIVDVAGVVVALRRLAARDPHEVVVALEEPSSRPGEGASRSLASGRNHGRIEGVLVALGLRFDLVRPQTWQQALGLGRDGDPKRRAIAYCRRVLPGLDLLATPRCTTPHDGIADAACLAEYARRELA